MALSGAFTQHIEQKILLGEGVCGSSYSPKCSVPSDMYTSKVWGQPGNVALPDVIWKEKSKSSGSLHPAYGEFSDPSRSSSCSLNTGVNRKLDLVADFLIMEKHVKKTKKKKKKKKMKGDSSGKSSKKIASETGNSKSGPDDAMASNQSSKEEVENFAINYDRCLKNDTISEGDLCVHNGKKITECYVEISDVTGDHLQVDISNCKNCENSSAFKDSKMIKSRPEEVSSNCLTEKLKDSFSFKHLLVKSSAPLNTISCKVEDCNGCSIEDTKTSNQHICACGTYNEVKLNSLMSQHDVVNKTSHHFNAQNENESSYLIQQKSLKNVSDAQYRESNRSKSHYEERDVSLMQKKFLVNHNVLTSKGLLPIPFVSSSGHNKATLRWINGSPYYHVLQSSQVGALETEDFYQLKSRHENNWNGKKSPGGFGMHFFRLHNKPKFSQKESLQIPCDTHYHRSSYAAQRSIDNSHHVVTRRPYCLQSSSTSSAHVQHNLPHSMKLGVQGQEVSKGYPPCNWTKVPRMGYALGGAFHTSVDSKQCSRFKIWNKDNFRQNVTSIRSAKKWIPVGVKECGMLERTSACICSDFDNNLPVSCEENGSHMEGNLIPHSGPASLSDFKRTNMTSGHKMTATISGATKLESSSAKDFAVYGKQVKDATQFLFCSQMASEALNAAYKLQLESEFFQLATGCPVAEIEGLLRLAAPVIASSYVCEKCTACLNNQLCHSFLCKHQIPSTSLRAVWNWYEKPGNYGLQVKAEDSRNLTGLLTDSISFHAHFVPFLSAVQLFSRTHFSNCYGMHREHFNPEVENKEGESHPSSPKTLFVTHSSDAIEVNHIWAENIEAGVNLDSIGDRVSSSKVHPCNRSDPPSSIISPACLSDTELIFEFFESEQPQQRKPLYTKILELIEAGTSNNHVYGDPSNLECVNLNDIHPASWFSVAWYPIYQIPEGSLRASFLTYHSLGHLVQRCIPTDAHAKNIFCIVSPVLGLQSYNAQGECWFNPKIPVESLLRESKPLNSSEILKERLRTLEENASLFARGCVYKNKVKVFNSQPDYEFFISRKF